MIVPGLESHVSWGYFPPPSGTAGEALLKLGSAGAAHYREVGVGLRTVHASSVARLSVVSYLED